MRHIDPWVGLLYLLSVGGAWAATVERKAVVSQSSSVKLASPDGAWMILTEPAADSGNAHIVLQATSGKTRQILGEYFRSGTVWWSPSGHLLLFIDDHSPEESRLIVYRVASNGGVRVDGVDRALRAAALTRKPPGRQLLYYSLALKDFEDDDRLIITVRIVYLKNAGLTGPAAEMNVDYVYDLRSRRVAAR